MGNVLSDKYTPLSGKNIKIKGKYLISENTIFEIP
jgi:hypothetical protein